MIDHQGFGLSAQAIILANTTAPTASEFQTRLGNGLAIRRQQRWKWLRRKRISRSAGDNISAGSAAWNNTEEVRESAFHLQFGYDRMRGLVEGVGAVLVHAVAPPRPELLTAPCFSLRYPTGRSDITRPSRYRRRSSVSGGLHSASANSGWLVATTALALIALLLLALVRMAAS